MYLIVLIISNKELFVPVEYSIVQSVVILFDISSCGNSISGFTTNGSVIFQIKTKSWVVCDTEKSNDIIKK